MQFGLKSSGQTALGISRSVNNDAVYEDVVSGIFAIADGAGMTDKGRIPASQVFTRTVEARTNDLLAAVGAAARPGASRAPLRTAFLKVFEQASSAIRKAFEVPPDAVGPTTTGTVLVIHGTHAAVGHVGNTRAYLVRAGRVFRITRDHTVAQRMADAGKIRPEEVPGHPQRGVLFQAVGQDAPLHIDVTFFKVSPDDRLVLLSDGIYEATGDAEIAEMHNMLGDHEAFGRALLDLARRRKADDDLACLVIGLEEDPDRAGEAPGFDRPERGTGEVNLDDPLRYFRHISLFAGMRDEQVLRLISVMPPFSVPSGQTLFEQGDRSDQLYVVTMGRVEVVRDGRTLAAIGPGNVVGELALLDGDVRSATVRVVSTARLLSLRRDDLQELTLSDPHFAVRLYHNLAETLARRLRQTSGRRQA